VGFCVNKLTLDRKSFSSIPALQKLQHYRLAGPRRPAAIASASKISANRNSAIPLDLVEPDHLDYAARHLAHGHARQLARGINVETFQARLRLSVD
jgi:hypothetical protein